VAAGKQSATKIKTTGSDPQTIGGKVGGSFAESKMRQQTLRFFCCQSKSDTDFCQAPAFLLEIAYRSGAVEADGSEDYRDLAMPSRRK
jgi:hypothetical protein